MRDCSDVGKKSLEDEDECQVAASQLGFSYDFDGSWSYVPKGCFLFLDNYVYWNNHEIGRSDNDTLSICRKGGNIASIDSKSISYVLIFILGKLDHIDVYYYTRMSSTNT